MRHRSTYILLACFAAALAALCWFEYAKVPDRGQQQEIRNRLLPELMNTQVGDIRRIVVTASDPKRSIRVERRDEGRWQIVEPFSAAADPNLVETLARNLCEMRKSNDAGTITDDPARYGLGPPRATLALYGSEASTPLAAVELGEVKQERIYVRTGPDRGIEVVDTRLLGAVNQPASAWRDRMMFRVPSFRVERVAIHESQPPRDVEVHRDERRWRMAAPVVALADDDKTEGLVAELGALRVVDGDAGFVANGVTDLARYGLDKPSMTITVTPFQGHGKPQVVTFGKPVPETTDQLYAIRGDQDDVVKVNVKILRETYPGPNALRSQKVNDFVLARARHLRIEAFGTVFDIAREGDGWHLERPVEEKADTASVQALLTALEGLRTSEFLDPAAAPDAGLEKPTYRIRLWQDEPGVPPSGAATPGAAPAGELRVDLRLGRVDAFKKSYFGQVAGDREVLAFPVGLLEALPRNEYAFRDLSVVSFNPAQLERLSFERDGKTVTLQAPGSGSKTLKWRMIEPVSAAVDDPSVTTAMLALANLRAAAWESGRVGDGREFGLDAPEIRIRWTLLDAPAMPAGAAEKGPGPKPGTKPPQTLRLGKVKRGTNHVFANIEGQPGVFSIHPSVVQAFGAEMHDHAIIAFPADQAQRVVLRWPSRSIAVVRKPGSDAKTWEPAPGYDPAGFDFARIGPLVNVLSDVKTPKFFQYQGPFPKDYELEPPLITLEVWTTGATAPKVLRIGKRLGDLQALATTEAGTAGAVFVIAMPDALKNVLTPPRRLSDLPADPFARPAPRN